MTFTITEANGFNEGGSQGNTARSDGSGTFFSSGSIPTNGAGLWHWRDFGSLNLFGVPDPAGLDLIEATPARLAPELRTTIAGLPSNTYEVYWFTPPAWTAGRRRNCSQY